jgi:hypothetical protein
MVMFSEIQRRHPLTDEAFHGGDADRQEPGDTAHVE